VIVTMSGGGTPRRRAWRCRLCERCTIKLADGASLRRDRHRVVGIGRQRPQQDISRSTATAGSDLETNFGRKGRHARLIAEGLKPDRSHCWPRRPKERIDPAVDYRIDSSSMRSPSISWRAPAASLTDLTPEWWRERRSVHAYTMDCCERLTKVKLSTAVALGGLPVALSPITPQNNGPAKRSQDGMAQGGATDELVPRPARAWRGSAASPTPDGQKNSFMLDGGIARQSWRQRALSHVDHRRKSRLSLSRVIARARSRDVSVHDQTRSFASAPARQQPGGRRVALPC